jgi:hypothetical protein
MIVPLAPHNDKRESLQEANTSDEHQKSRNPSSKINFHPHQSVYVELIVPGTAQGITGSPHTTDLPRKSTGRCTTRSSERSIRLPTGVSSCTSARLNTTDLLRANEALRRENERLRLRLLRAQASDAGDSTPVPDPPGLSVPPSSAPPSVRGTASRLPRSRGSGAALPPPPPSGGRAAATPATPATPGQPPPLPPPPPLAPRSAFAGFFRHCSRPGRPGRPCAGNLSDLRFREWVGHAPSLF